MFYSPDSYGLGHERRSISLAKAALSRIPGSSALLLTRAPRAHYFEYPPRCEYLRLPSITEDREGQYVCRDLDLSLEKVVKLPSRLIQVAMDSFEARILRVDHSPLGLCGEILPTLRELAGKTARVLGMRDVIDDPDRVRAAWDKDGTIDVLRECYDRILIYGQREVFDPIREYGIPPDVARKMSFVGYISRNGRKAIPGVLKARFAPRTGRLVVVTLGGGLRIKVGGETGDDEVLELEEVRIQRNQEQGAGELKE
jgi:predicted glycosyltransferase